MSAVALTMLPTKAGWSVCFTNGEQLVEYRGAFSKRRAIRYLQSYAEQAQDHRLTSE